MIDDLTCLLHHAPIPCATCVTNGLAKWPPILGDDCGPLSDIAAREGYERLRGEVERLRMQHEVAVNAAELMTVAHDRVRALVAALTSQRDEARVEVERLNRDVERVDAMTVVEVQHETAEQIAVFVGDSMNTEAPGDWRLLPRRIRAMEWKRVKTPA
jgi:hypothetical protein